MKHKFIVAFTAAFIAVAGIANESNPQLIYHCTFDSTNVATVTQSSHLRLGGSGKNAAIVAAAPAAEGDNKSTSITATASLKDGSTVKGEFIGKRIVGSTVFMEKLALDPSLVNSVTFTGTNGDAKVELAGGDKFAMKVKNGAFPIKTIFGELKIPRRTVRTLAFSASRHSTCGADNNGLIFHCTFDNEASLVTPIAGPSVKLELGEIASDKGKNGGALYVKPGIAGAQIVFPAGTFHEEGCIEFWANMASGKTEFTTGGDPTFFLLLSSDGGTRGGLAYASNDGMGNSGLCGTFFNAYAHSNRGYSGMMPYSDIFKGEDYNGWHHYALTWTRSNIIVFLDGKQLCASTTPPDTSMFKDTELTMEIPLNRKTGKSYINKSAFFMDELKIWNFPKKNFDLN